MAVIDATTDVYGPGTTGCDCLRPGGCAACHDFYDQLRDEEESGEGAAATDTDTAS
jgi:hypothetical protein